MDDFDDDLEVAIASGLDVPTALAVADKRPRGGCWWVTLLLLLAVVLLCWLF